MADLSVTATSVQKGAAALGTLTTASGTAGASITAGQPVYLDSTGLVQVAGAGGLASNATAVGIALNNAAAGQPVTYGTAGPINIGATTVLGTVYVLSINSGAIAPCTDAVAGWRTVILGVAIAANTILLGIVHNSGAIVHA